ncbi:hypothetical protein D3C72_1263240 [compost metagenome]
MRGARQAVARVELHAGGQRERGGEHRAGRMNHIARAVADRAAQHRAGRQHEVRRQRGARGQLGPGAQAHGLDRQGVVERAARLEEGAVGQRDLAVGRHHHVAAPGHAALDQHPAVVVRRDGQRGAVEAIGHAAKDLEVPAGTHHQRARLAGAAHAGLLRMRVDARVAVAGQVDIPVDMQVAIGRDRDDLHAGAQVEGIRVGAQAGQPAGHQVAVGQRVAHEGQALRVLLVQVALGDGLVVAPIGRAAGNQRRVVVGLEGVDGDRARAVDAHAA